MNERLTGKELKHLQISQAWLGLFVQLCFDYPALTDWRIGGWILDINNLFMAALNHHEPLRYDAVNGQFARVEELDDTSRADRIKALKTVIGWEDSPGFGAGNETLRKYVTVVDAGENWSANHAYMDIWDADYINAPKLVFIGTCNASSFAEFRALYTRFMQTETEDEVEAFRQYVERTYNTTDS